MFLSLRKIRICDGYSQEHSNIVAKLTCKKALELTTISAIAARDTAEGEMLTFDTNGETEDLTTPQKATSRQ